MRTSKWKRNDMKEEHMEKKSSQQVPLFSIWVSPRLLSLGSSPRPLDMGTELFLLSLLKSLANRTFSTSKTPFPLSLPPSHYQYGGLTAFAQQVQLGEGHLELVEHFGMGKFRHEADSAGANLTEWKTLRPWSTAPQREL
ncbi:hypothetical protein Y1Q_0006446 [Alligator mississippiensis]|uniref:Uncharacterized protein n=1 Tax=Alligator mississippiensis TaxID=8496 RepID=A0A151NYN1_ALLMI|nr:hypothetical protein Y1Q_0006446 [Alligator mississippiensis]